MNYNFHTEENEYKIKLDIIKGIFLLILAVSGSYVGETMNCQMRKLLLSNMFAKNIIILMIIYFALGFASNEHSPNPLYIIKQTMIIWLFFLIFNKMDLPYIIIVSFILFATLICKNYISYFNTHEDKKYKEKIPFIEDVSNILITFSVLISIVGFFIYFRKQRLEYKDSFSYVKFIFGSTKCKNLL